MKKILKSSVLAGAGASLVLGLVLVPSWQAGAVTVNPTVRAIVAATITLTTTSQGSSNNVDINLTPGASAVLSSASDTLTVNTNDTLGYLLTLADADTTYTLTSGANTIAASANAIGSGATLATNTWGFALPGGTGFDATYTAESNSTTSTSKWSAIPASGTPYTLKSTATTASNDQTVVWYAAKVDSTKPTGTYTDQVVYTATAK